MLHHAAFLYEEKLWSNELSCSVMRISVILYFNACSLKNQQHSYNFLYSKTSFKTPRNMDLTQNFVSTWCIKVHKQLWAFSCLPWNFPIKFSSNTQPSSQTLHSEVNIKYNGQKHWTNQKNNHFLRFFFFTFSISSQTLSFYWNILHLQITFSLNRNIRETSKA